MKGIFYARVKLPHLSFDQVVGAYAGWALGVDATGRTESAGLT